MAVKITLGQVQDVTRLYSYPNNFNEVGFLQQSLEQTVETWVKSSLVRDGFTATASVSIEGGDVILSLDGPGDQSYADLLPKYLAAGQLGLNGCIAVNTSKMWLYN